MTAAIADEQNEPRNGLGRNSLRPAHNRGPLRPRTLVTRRAANARRLGSFAFRGVDLALVAVVSLAVLAGLSPDGLLNAQVRLALPVVLGAVATGWLLRLLGCYRFVRRERLRSHLGSVLQAGVGGWAVALLAARLTAEAPLARTWAWSLSVTLSLLIVHTLWWVWVRQWRQEGYLTPNLVIVGATNYAAQLISDALQRRHVNVLGIFDDRLERAPSEILGVPVLGSIEKLLGHSIMPYVDRVVVAVEPSATKRVREISAQLAPVPNEVTLFLTETDDLHRSQALDRLEDLPLADVDGENDPNRRAFRKRVEDVLLGSVLLVALSPIMLLIGLAVVCDSRGGMFFRQCRHGFNQEEIKVWKFRTMRAESADAHAHRQVSADDDRVTRVGRVLRSTGLDELPQLINVVRGEMSLVGPRPHAIGMRTGDTESAALVAEYAQRHRVKPGMTGWAAVHGSRGPLHSARDVQQRVAWDIDYITRQSFGLDLWIMLRTVPGLLGDRHAIR